MTKVIPERIRLARKLCRYSMEDLVRNMGASSVSRMAISKIERGLMNPSSVTLQAIAGACCLPVSFFCDPALDLGTLDYRFKEEVKESQRCAITAMADNLLRYYFRVQSIEGDSVQFSNIKRGAVLHNYSDAEIAAFKLRRKWDLGLQPIHSVYELLSCYGFHILEFDFGYANIDGLSTFVNGNKPVILINTLTNTTTERKRFTALHELCHLLFNLRPDNERKHQAYLDSLPSRPYPVIIKRPDDERLCDFFASAMLLPEQCVLRRFGKTRTRVSIDEFISTRNLYGISIAAQIHRLHDLCIIEEDLYNSLFETIIHPNRKEDGLGEYPIMEKGDRQQLLEERLRSELMDEENKIKKE